MEKNNTDERFRMISPNCLPQSGTRSQGQSGTQVPVDQVPAGKAKTGQMQNAMQADSSMTLGEES